MSKEQWNSKGRGVAGEAVTPSDTADNEFDCLYIGGTGDLVVELRDDTSPSTFSARPVGDFPYSVKKVYSTGTTATNILGITVGR